MTDGIEGALARQARTCRSSGSKLYGALLDEVVADWRRSGPCRWVITTGAYGAGRQVDPVASGLPLRFMAALHRLVLSGGAPALAAHFPSVGGQLGPGIAGALDEAVSSGRERLAEWMRDPVQTNEVGRSAALMCGLSTVARRSGLPLRILEVGASAGLNLRFDRYWFDTGRSSFGDPSSAVRFGPNWWRRAPQLASSIPVVEAAGCDLRPIDPAEPIGALRLRSYVWADQLERLGRLDAAIAAANRADTGTAGHTAVRVDEADAIEWLESELSERSEDMVTVVMHSIVLQYLEPSRRQVLGHLVRAAGRGARATAPLAWLRLEPAGPRAELRLDLWPRYHSGMLAEVAYHGRPVEWCDQAWSGAEVGRSPAR